MKTTSVPYGLLNFDNPGIDREYLSELWALYSGGRDLLKGEALNRLFPMHTDEAAQVYMERKRRAQYTNHAGALVDFLASAMVSDPVQVTTEGGDTDFWEEFVKDLSPPGGKETSANQLVKRQIISALIFQCAWTLVDMPKVEGEADSEADQEASGILNVYAKSIDPRCVVEWEDGEDGDLKWALLKFVDMPREELAMPRILIRERYYAYTKERWYLWEVKYHDSDKFDKLKGDGLIGEDIVKLEKPDIKDKIEAREGMHSFEAVPLVRTELDPGLWAMNKLHSLAKSYFNRECAHTWFLLKSHFPILYEFLSGSAPGIDEAVDEFKEDQNRSVSQTRGIGWVQTRSTDDRAEYVSPDVAAVSHMLEAQRSLRDELHRIVFQLALAVENTAAAQGRSGDSKAQDRMTMQVLLGELGRIGREFIKLVFTLASKGRKSPGEVKVVVKGLTEFTERSVSDLVEQVVSLEMANIPSPTFHQKLKSMLARAMVGHECSEEELETIVSELKAAITGDTFLPLPAPSGEDLDDDVKKKADDAVEKDKKKKEEKSDDDD